MSDSPTLELAAGPEYAHEDASEAIPPNSWTFAELLNTAKSEQ